MIQTTLVSNEDDQVIPIHNSINNAEKSNNQHDCSEEQSSESNIKTTDANPKSLPKPNNKKNRNNRKKNKNNKKVEEPIEVPRLPVIGDVEIVEAVQEEGKDAQSGENGSVEASNLTPSAYRKKSLLDAPENSRRRSKSRKRSRSRHNVVYHFGMA